MEKATRRRYTLEYKQEAVRLVASGQKVTTAAKALGIVEQTLANWVTMERDILHPTNEDLFVGTPVWEKPRRTSRRCSDEVRLD